MSDSKSLVKLNELNQQKAMKLLQLKFLKKPVVQNDYRVKFECKTCGENCTGFSGDSHSREFMENHLKKHIHQCPHCDKKFPLVQDVIDHIGRIHLHNFFFCANCTYRTHNKADLSIHIAKKHGELVSHDCEKCNKQFQNARSLKNHEEVVHPSEPPALCQFCGFIAPTHKKLQWHERKYHEKAEFQCTICKRELMTELGLKKHLENHETKSTTAKTYECKDCGRIFGKINNLKKHSLCHSGIKPMECNVCHARFAKRSTLRQHLLTHTGKRPYSCDICGKTFVQKPGLTGHRKSHPGVHPPLPKVYIDSFIKEVDPTCVASPPAVPKIKIKGETYRRRKYQRKRNGHECPHCNVIFFHMMKLVEHLKNVHNISNAFNCDECGKAFRTPMNITRHKLIHTGEKKFNCDLCDYTCNQKSNLEFHKKRHMKDYSFRCETCDRGFFFKCELLDHENVHKNLKPYKCEICKKSYPQRKNLTSHLREEHDENKGNQKLKECKICHDKFSDAKTLKNHRREVHLIDYRREALCDICGIKLCKDTLKSHERIHSGVKKFNCDICDKSFTKKSGLVVHRRIHTGEKPYVCKQCGKKFTQQISLIIHLRYHNDERPYSCDLCEKSFVTGTHLKNHRTKVHGGV